MIIIIIYVWRHLRAPLHIMYTANSYKFHVCCFLLPKPVFRKFCTNSQKSTASLRHLSRWVCYCTCCIHAREGRPLTQLLGIVWQSKFVMQSTLITKFWNFFSVSDSSLSMLKKSWFVASWSWLFYTLWCGWCSLALALGYHRKFNLRLEFTNAVWNTVICVLHQNIAELDRTVNCCLANRYNMSNTYKYIWYTIVGPLVYSVRVWNCCDLTTVTCAGQPQQSKPGSSATAQFCVCQFWWA